MTEITRFDELDNPDQLVVRLRADGKTYKQISDALLNEFGIEKDAETVRNWFRNSGSNAGRLVEPYAEFKHMLSTESIDQARSIIHQAQPKAAERLIRLLDSRNDLVVHRAATSILGSILEAPTDRMLEEARIAVKREAIENSPLKQMTLEELRALAAATKPDDRN